MQAPSLLSVKGWLSRLPGRLPYPAQCPLSVLARLVPAMDRF